MATDHDAPKLNAGSFFGHSRRALSTPSFDFSELDATVPERQVPRHTHETAHFVLITRGLYLTEARKGHQVSTPGTLIFNPAGTTHRDRFQSAAGRFLTISPRRDPSLVLETSLPDFAVVLQDGISPAHRPLACDRMAREARDLSFNSAVVLESLGFELIGLLSGPDEGHSSLRIPAWLPRSREMIQDCFASELSVAEVAAAIGVHPVYLARAYRKHLGCSPGEYLRHCRLRRARELLERTDTVLAQIALDCGFSDQSQLTRSFSNMFGMSPGRYRCFCRQFKMPS